MPGAGGKELSDRAFMAGVLSLIDVLFEVSMDELVEKLNLVDDVRDGASGSNRGARRRCSLLAEKLEKADFDGVERATGALRPGPRSAACRATANHRLVRPTERIPLIHSLTRTFLLM